MADHKVTEHFAYLIGELSGDHKVTEHFVYIIAKPPGWYFGEVEIPAPVRLDFDRDPQISMHVAVGGRFQRDPGYADRHTIRIKWTGLSQAEHDLLLPILNTLATEAQWLRTYTGEEYHVHLTEDSLSVEWQPGETITYDISAELEEGSEDL